MKKLLAMSCQMLGNTRNYVTGVFCLKAKSCKLKAAQGFTLLFAVLIGSILLAIGLAIFSIATKELALSSTGRESQFAFYAADSGVECALYWDRNYNNGSAFATSTAGTISCNGETITTGSQSNIPLTPPRDSLIGGGGVSQPTSVFKFDFNRGSEPKPYCAIVTVEKRIENGRTKTIIESRGRNDCLSNRNPSRVERAIRVQYES